MSVILVLVLIVLAIALIFIKSILPFAIGALFFGVGLWILLRDRIFFKKAIIVYGEISRITIMGGGSSNRRRRLVYAPVVKYEYNGEVSEVAGNIYSPKMPQVGQVMQVGINPKNPKDVRVKQSGASFVLPVIFMFVGAVVLFFSVVDQIPQSIGLQATVTPIIVAVIDAGMIILGIWLIIRDIKFYRKAVFVQGRVIGVSSHNRSYSPIVEFEYNGKIRQIESEDSSSKMPIEGQLIKVGVNPDNPEDARVKASAFSFMSLIPIFMGVVGLYLSIFGIK